MKLTYKGKYTSEDQLPKGVLPPNAVKFVEPATPGRLNLVASLFILPALLLIGVFVLVSSLLHGSEIIRPSHSLSGFVLAFLVIYPHELLHAICFGKNAEVEMFIIPRLLTAFVYSTQPISKARFIFLSLFPNLIFGWFPLSLWMIFPHVGIFSNILFWFSVMSIFFGAGDF